jgi:hypothetical protein
MKHVVLLVAGTIMLVTFFSAVGKKTVGSILKLLVAGIAVLILAITYFRM